jgi:predicted GNAT superfamily acetyltransferase
VKSRKNKVVKNFMETINNGGSVFGAYDNNKLIGFAVLYNGLVRQPGWLSYKSCIFSG